MIYDTSVRLLGELWDGAPLRLLGVRVTKLDEPEYEQLSLFDSEENQKQEKLDKAIDAIRERFGAGAVKRASVLSAELPATPKNSGGQKRDGH